MAYLSMSAETEINVSERSVSIGAERLFGPAVFFFAPSLPVVRLISRIHDLSLILIDLPCVQRSLILLILSLFNTCDTSSSPHSSLLSSSLLLGSL